jgi:phospholipid-binding lipoprotein MlaA
MRKLNCLLILSAFLLIVSSVPSFSTDLASADHFRLNAEYFRNYSDDDLNSGQTHFDAVRFQEDQRYKMYAQADDAGEENWEEEEGDLDYLEEDNDDNEIADPFEPVNRAFFAVNDKLYFWVLKPVTKGYSFLFPEPVRISVNNFFDNVAMPIRFVNNLLQFKFKRAGKELLRFGINSTVGVLGLFDPAGDSGGIKVNEDEDFGQTLGVWGLGSGFYMNLPLLGPSSLRDAVGSAGDYFLDPVNYVNPLIDQYAIKAGSGVNKASFKIGDYEEIKKDALDPYAAIRDIYNQYRRSKVSR